MTNFVTEDYRWSGPNGLETGLICSDHPEYGGIIDRQIGGGWFVIWNQFDDIAENIVTREDAINTFNKRVSQCTG